MDDMYAEQNDILELILGGSGDPTNLSLPFLRYITSNFSNERKIGSGGFGIVYKGIFKRGIVAVKKVSSETAVNEELFYHEVNSLMTVKHKNIVRFLGFCANTENIPWKDPESLNYGRYIYPEKRERLLCFEYVGNGALDNHITDELRGHEWNTRYQIIKGICEGLLYLHEETKIVHRDLKPPNILLDDLMAPKITDFGISKFLEGESQATASNLCMSLGYCAPEFIQRREVSYKSDIYSLGVIITEVVTGSKKYPDMENVLRRWRYRWNKSKKQTPWGCQQVAKCIEIGLLCQNSDPQERPCISTIIRHLSEIESTNWSSYESRGGQTIPYCSDLLLVEPLDLYFPIETSLDRGEAPHSLANRALRYLYQSVSRQRSDDQIPISSCSLELSNRTDDHVGFSIRTTSRLQFCTVPYQGIVPPRSSCSVTISLLEEPQDHHLTEDIFVVRSTKAKVISSEEMFEKDDGRVVDQVRLTVQYCKPPLLPEEPQLQECKALYCHASELCFSSALQEDIRQFDRGKYLQLINKADQYAAFQIIASGYTICPSRGTVPPSSTFHVFISPNAVRKPVTCDTICVQSVRVYKGTDVTDEVFRNKTVYSFTEEDVKAVYSGDDRMPSDLVQLAIDLPRSTTSVDLHSTEPWCLCVCNGTIEIWDYDNKVQVLAPYRVKRKLRPWIPRDITIAKFCEREKYIVAGSSDGYIYIYSYAELPNINEISRRHSSNSSIRSIDVHPTETYVMSSAHNCCDINRWNWTRSWSTIFHHTGSVTVLKCDPNNYSKFASGSSDGTVKIWHTWKSEGRHTLHGHSSGVTCLDFVMWESKEFLISGSNDKTVKVWDYNTGNCLHTLEDTCAVRAVCGYPNDNTRTWYLYSRDHPTIPTIFAGLADGTIRLWNSYRLESSFSWYGDTKGIICAISRKDPRCVAVRYAEAILILRMVQREGSNKDDEEKE